MPFPHLSHWEEFFFLIRYIPVGKSMAKQPASHTTGCYVSQNNLVVISASCENMTLLFEIIGVLYLVLLAPSKK